MILKNILLTVIFSLLPMSYIKASQADELAQIRATLAAIQEQKAPLWPVLDGWVNGTICSTYFFFNPQGLATVKANFNLCKKNPELVDIQETLDSLQIPANYLAIVPEIEQMIQLNTLEKKLHTEEKQLVTRQNQLLIDID